MLLIAIAGLTAVRGADQTRNAIFNGDFLEGRSGWVIGGPPEVQVKAHRTMIAERADAELTLQHPGLSETMTVYSQYPIGVKPGRAYTMTLTAGGEGTIAFGVYEYDERGKNTVFPLSPAIDLTAEPQTYSFSYTASDRADTIRPRIRILGRAAPRGEPVAEGQAAGQGKPFRVRLLRFELLLPQAEFAASVKWPEWAVSGAVKNYHGLSDEEVRRIQQAVAVDRVLPPYQPIRTEGEGVYALTTSRFDFGGSVLPRQITILGESILAGPIELNLVGADSRSLTSADGPTTYTGDERQVVARRTARGEGWTLAMTGTLEYDALLVVDLELHAEHPVELGGGSLTIPFPDRIARYIRYDRQYLTQGARVGYGPLPQPGQTVETKLVFGRAKIKNDWRIDSPAPSRGTIWSCTGTTPRYFWIGDEDKGLGWIAESDQGWSNGPEDVTWALDRTADGLAVKLNLVTRTVTVTDTWKLRFMIQAMPPKPVRADWFKMRFNRFWNWRPGDEKMIARIEAMRADHPPAPTEDPPPLVRYAQATTGDRELRPPWQPRADLRWRDYGLLWWDIWSVGCGSPQVGDAEAMRRYLAAGTYVGHMQLPYFAPTHLSVNDLNGYYYGTRTEQWAKLPTSGSGSAYVKICPNSFASEYQADAIGRLIDEYGIDGVYFDNTHPEECANREHGCGWVDAAGVTHPTIPFLGMRRIFMMVREQFVKRGKTPFIFKHAGMFPAEVSFVDANLDGEGIYGYDHTQMLTPGEFRAQWIGPNQFGLVEVYLPQFATGLDTKEVSAGEQVRRGTGPLLAMALVHGTPLYCGNLNWVPTFQAWGVLDELRSDTVEFIPYWRWPVNQTLNQRELYASLYRQPEQAVLAVANLSASQADVAIPRRELERLIPGLVRAEDHMNAGPVQLDEQSLRLSVPAKNFRLISLD